MTIAVHGLGAVGLVHAAALGARGHDVVGVDPDPRRRAALSPGAGPFPEPGLAALLAEAHGRARLLAVPSAIGIAADVHLVCVATPSLPDGSADLGALDAVQRALAELRPSLVILRSTVPPGTCRRFAAALGVPLAFAPELTREGSALADLAEPPLVVLAATSPAAAAQALALLPIGDAAKCRAEVVDFELAELLKYACNAWHALKVAFANEIGALAERHGADGTALMRVFVRDRAANLSERYLAPGAPFGGGCLPKDVRALAADALAAGIEAPLIGNVIASNEAHQRRVLERVLATRPRRVAVIGLAFKGDTDDVRESPAVDLVRELERRGVEVSAFDASPDLALPFLPAASLDEAIAGADVVVCHHASMAREVRGRLGPEQRLIDLTH